ncbi:hypothetical protein CVS40_4854 [Lucilia cuprina]|nr:hypothetical protein CVS40_4854 [Lucilia cuprina]
MPKSEAKSEFLRLLTNVTDECSAPFQVSVEINKVMLDFVLDTGLLPCGKKLCAYGGDVIDVIAVFFSNGRDFMSMFDITLSNRRMKLHIRSTNVVNTGDGNTTEPTCMLGYTPVKTKNENQARTSTTTTSKCYECGGQHLRRDCKFKNAKCFSCGKLSHIGKVCDDDEMVQFINHVGIVRTNCAVAKENITVNINGKNVDMELDTGAPCSVMCIRKFNALNDWIVLERQYRRLNLYTFNNNVDTLCGRELIANFACDINFIELFDTNIPSDSSERNMVSSTEQNMNTISVQTSILTTEQQRPAVKVHLKSGAKPIFARPREIPFALRDAYAKEIDAKISAGFYKKVDFLEWSSTTHIVIKKNGGIRITGNYKPTINPQMVIDEHPIPKTQDIFNKMKGAAVFAHLDVTDAYSHLVVDEEFAHVLTLNTPTRGLIRLTRAVYISKNIPAIWQREMETVLQNIPNILNFFDDILIYAENLDELFKTLVITLERLLNLGFKLNMQKCVFAASSIEFLGHKIDDQGIHKSNKHIDTILHSSKPSTTDDLQLFLGKASYYSNYIPNLSTLERPLRDIIKSGKFSWCKGADEAYERINNIFISPQVLTPYGYKQNRAGCCTFPSFTGQPRATNSICKSYNDHHKPLVQILQPSKSLPVLCISRMANYTDFLSNFDFNVVHKSSKENANADYLNEVSSTLTDSEYDEFDNFVIRQINQLPLTVVRIAQKTRKDDHLGKILKLLESVKCLAGYGYKSPEVNYKLSAGCLNLVHQNVIPPKFRPVILEQLHGSHLGVPPGLEEQHSIW